MNSINFISRFDEKYFGKLRKRQQNSKKNNEFSKENDSVVLIGSSITSQTLRLTGYGMNVVLKTASLDCEVAIGAN